AQPPVPARLARVPAPGAGAVLARPPGGVGTAPQFDQPRSFGLPAGGTAHAGRGGGGRGGRRGSRRRRRGRPRAGGRRAARNRRRVRGRARGGGRGDGPAPGDLRTGDGQASGDPARERRDRRLPGAGEQRGRQEDGVEVFIGVVVGEDRAAEVGCRPSRGQIAGGGEDRVHRVVRVGVARVESVHAVLDPGRRHELHPPDRAGRGDRLVAAVVGLDFVDRGEDLPWHAVPDGGRLVDGKQKQRDPVEPERLGGYRRFREFRGEGRRLDGEQLRGRGHVVGRSGRGGMRGRLRGAPRPIAVLWPGVLGGRAAAGALAGRGPLPALNDQRRLRGPRRRVGGGRAGARRRWVALRLG